MTSIWAISDPHLSFGVPEKNMNVFGPQWESYEKKMEMAWKDLIQPQDLVLIPGDISWAMNFDDALIDLEWIHALPGTKVIIKGNHDYWWGSTSKMKSKMPPSIHFIYNNHFDWNEVTLGGSRLWDTKEYQFNSLVDFQENPRENILLNAKEEDEKIFQRELQRLRLSLSSLNPKAHTRIALTHYPPIGTDLYPSAASAILEEFKIHFCVFGHLHNLKKSNKPLFGTARGVTYFLTSCDYLDFIPAKILSL